MHAEQLPEEKAKVEIPGMEHLPVVVLGNDGCTHSEQLIENVVHEQLSWKRKHV